MRALFRQNRFNELIVRDSRISLGKENLLIDRVLTGLKIFSI